MGARGSRAVFLGVEDIRVGVVYEGKCTCHRQIVDTCGGTDPKTMMLYYVTTYGCGGGRCLEGERKEITMKAFLKWGRRRVRVPGQ